MSLGHYLFTELLLPALEAGAKSSPDKHSRVMTTSSGGAYIGELKYDTFRDSRARRKAGNHFLYYQSKLVRSFKLRIPSKMVMLTVL